MFKKFLKSKKISKEKIEKPKKVIQKPKKLLVKEKPKVIEKPKAQKKTQPQFSTTKLLTAEGWLRRQKKST